MTPTIDTLKKLADELAAARRWNDAKAVQEAITALQAIERPMMDEEPASDLHERMLTR